MGKRFWSLALSMALIGGAFSVLPARAQESPAPAVPATPNIVDPKGDANFLNSGTAAPLGQDNVTPADGSSIADLIALWFSHTGTTVSVHWQAEAFPPGGNGVGYQAFASPGEGSAGSSTVGCLRFVLNIPGTNPGGGSYQDKPWVRLLDRCNVGTSIFTHAIDGEYTIHEGPEQSGIMTATFPRSYSPLLADGQNLSAPTAAAHSPLVGSHSVAYASPSTDNTKVGADYILTAGSGSAEEPKEEPPGKNDPPGSPKAKKKGCPKGKGKKKGACPKPKPAASSCPAYVPGEMGKDAESSIVTDAATEEKPIEVDVPVGPATSNVGSDRTTRMKYNVQVDSAAAESGLFIRLESPPLDDPDLYAYWPEGGKPAAVAGGFNPLLVGGPLPNPTNHATITGLNGQGQGGHSEFTAEQIDGLKTADCQGWTLDLVNWAGRGGYTLKLWLGEPTSDPAPPASEQSATTSFYDLLMSF